MSNSQTIIDLIKRGEDDSLDFKKNITNLVKIAKTIVSFANTHGGDIIVGVDDFGEVHKIDIQEEKYMLIKAAKEHCVPPIYIYFDTIKDKEDEVLVAHVKKSNEEHKVITERGDLLPYIRVKDQSILAPHAQLSEIIDEDIPIFNEEDQQYLIQYLKERKYITISDYMKLMKISFPIAVKSLGHLKDSGVIKEELVNKKARYSLI